MLRVLGLIWAGLALAGCAYGTQTTSGADFLAGYDDPAYAAGAGTDAAQALDAEIRAIAAVEPSLHFPARIGLARLEARQLTTVPPEELVHWGALADGLAPDVGEFVPVSPLIAAMVDPQAHDPRRMPTPADLIADIRRGAARQHLDYVLVYELSGAFTQTSNAFSAADVTILGFFLLPSREVQIRGAANALLLDVRNGYPYGTAAAVVEDAQLSRGSTAWERGQAGAERIKIEAVADLTGEVEAMVRDLQSAALAEASLREGARP